MQKIQGFLVGFVVGAALMFVGLRYHVSRATDGYHVIPKVTAHLRMPYTDIREFTVDDWQSNADLVVAITRSKNTTLQQEAAKGAVGNTLDDAWREWMGQGAGR